MEILNKLFSGGKPKEESSNHEGEYMQEAKAAVEIVNKGVEKGSFSEMTETVVSTPISLCLILSYIWFFFLFCLSVFHKQRNTIDYSANQNPIKYKHHK